MPRFTVKFGFLWSRSVECTLFCKLSHRLYFLVSANTVLLICFLLSFFPFLFFPSLPFTFLYWHMIFWHSPGWSSDPPCLSLLSAVVTAALPTLSIIVLWKICVAIPSSYPQILWVFCSVISPFDQTWTHLEGFIALHILDYVFLILLFVSILLMGVQQWHWV